MNGYLAAVLGDNVGYMIGRWGGQRVLHRLGVKEDHLRRTEHFFEHYGGGIVVVARFIVILRQLNGVVAGSMHMPWGRFLLFNVLGGVLWVTFWCGGVYYLGRHFEQIEQSFRGLMPYAVVTGLIALFGLLWYLKSGRKT
ncbi:MAG TPA: DedA family protein [Thiolinea sp.]|nr:DedA family protein [Thiolinea sp.]